MIVDSKIWIGAEWSASFRGGEDGSDVLWGHSLSGRGGVEMECYCIARVSMYTRSCVDGISGLRICCGGVMAGGNERQCVKDDK